MFTTKVIIDKVGLDFITLHFESNLGNRSDEAKLRIKNIPNYVSILRKVDWKNKAYKKHNIEIADQLELWYNEHQASLINGN